MKLLIEIPEKTYHMINTNVYDYGDMNMIIQNGIPLEQQPSDDCVSLAVYTQVTWERDIAIEQLKELGYGFGEKIRTSEDSVSRAEVNKLYDEYRPRLATHVSEFGDKLKALPSITPTETMPDNEQKVLVSPCFGRIF